MTGREEVDAYICGTGENLRGCPTLPSWRMVWVCGCQQLNEWVCEWHGKMTRTGVGHDLANECKHCHQSRRLVGVDHVREENLPEVYRTRKTHCWLCKKAGSNLVPIRVQFGAQVWVCPDARQCAEEERTTGCYIQRGNWVRGPRHTGPYLLVDSDVDHDRVQGTATFRDPYRRVHVFGRNNVVYRADPAPRGK